MTDSSHSPQVGYDCESRCVTEFVECMDAEDEASICKTRERNCMGECPM
jgi:hypothetical protein